MMNERGRKTRAGKLLSSYIRTIAEEQTELIKGPDGEDRMATKAEALARSIWQRALGWKEYVGVGEERREIVHQPDKQLAELLFTRMEGRAPLTIGDSAGVLSTAERVSEQSKKRINGIIDDGGG